MPLSLSRSLLTEDKDKNKGEGKGKYSILSVGEEEIDRNGARGFFMMKSLCFWQWQNGGEWCFNRIWWWMGRELHR